MNKKALIIFSLSALCAINSIADDFSWSDYKKTLPSSIIEGNDKTKSEKTRENIKKHLGVDVERRTLEEIRQDQTTKNLTISALFRNTQTYTEGGTEEIPGVSAAIPGTESTTTPIGVSITGRFDLMSIGKKMPNVYATIDVYQDNIWMGLSRRIQAYNRLGLFSDVGAGLFFQMIDTTRTKDMYLYGYYDLGWNFKEWNIKAGIKIPSDAFDNGFFDTTQYSIAIGWRF